MWRVARAILLLDQKDVGVLLIQDPLPSFQAFCARERQGSMATEVEEVVAMYMSVMASKIRLCNA